MTRAGWVLTGLLLAFLLPASVAPKLLQAGVAVDSLTAIGWSPAFLPALGVLEAALLALYVWPRTAPLGAVLFTALLGGTVASHLRAGSPLASHTLFGVYLGVALWLALWLRDPALRAFVRGYLSPAASSTAPASVDRSPSAGATIHPATASREASGGR